MRLFERILTVMDDYDEGNERVIACCTVAEDGDRPRVTYILSASAARDGCGTAVYSLICKSEDDEAVMPDVARTEERALELFSVFVRNTVTPVGCFDIIEELI